MSGPIGRAPINNPRRLSANTDHLALGVESLRHTRRQSHLARSRFAWSTVIAFVMKARSATLTDQPLKRRQVK